MAKKTSSKKELSSSAHEALLSVLQTRFEKNMNRLRVSTGIMCKQSSTQLLTNFGHCTRWKEQEESPT